jgi:hypothetical protein
MNRERIEFPSIIEIAPAELRPRSSHHGPDALWGGTLGRFPHAAKRWPLPPQEDLGKHYSARIVDDVFGGNTFVEILVHIVSPLALPIPIPLPPVLLPFRGILLRESTREAVDKLASAIKDKLATFEPDLSVQIAKALPRTEQR